MLLDGRALESPAIEADLCIVGTGAAGITIAREFANTSVSVVLLESGAFEADADTMQLNQGGITGLPYFPLEACRLRFFGGTTNHWGGWCMPPQAHDMEQRSWIPDTGWPFSLEHLAPFYARAHKLCELSEYNYSCQFWSSSETPVLPLDPDGLVSVTTQFSPPTRFGLKYRDDVVRPENIKVVLHANAHTIETRDAQVTRISCATLSGKRFVVSAKYFVLAMGGIENPRLLLLSRSQNEQGLGNANDLVGRYFADSFVSDGGEIIFSDTNQNVDFYQRHISRGQPVKGYLQPSKRAQEELGMTTVTYAIEPVFDPYYERASRSDGVASFNHLQGSLKNGTVPDNLGFHLGRIIGDIDDVGATAYRKLVHGDMPISHYRFSIGQDCAPNRDSRVRLGDEVDALGQRKAVLDWKIQDIDRHTFRTAQRFLAQEVGRQGLGRVRVASYGENDWPQLDSGAMRAGWHHLGTTRMHADSRLGVVDPDCRLHEAGNLFVAGSSVFPSFEGQPTLTIVALSLRLSDHLKKLLRNT